MIANSNTTTTTISFPTINIPFTNQQGIIALPWFRLLQSFYNTLGSNPTNIAGLETEIVALQTSVGEVQADIAVVEDVANSAAVAAESALALQSLVFDTGGPTESFPSIADLLVFDAPDAPMGAPLSVTASEDLAQEVENLKASVKELQAYIYAINTGTN